MQCGDEVDNNVEISNLDDCGFVSLTINDPNEVELLNEFIDKGQFSHRVAMKSKAVLVFQKSLREEFESLNKQNVFRTITTKEIDLHDYPSHYIL